MEFRHYPRTMKGNILIIFAVLAVAVGAGTTILLSNAKGEIKIKNAKIDTLQKDKTQLEESKKQLTQDINKLNNFKYLIQFFLIRHKHFQSTTNLEPFIENKELTNQVDRKLGY